MFTFHSRHRVVLTWCILLAMLVIGSHSNGAIAAQTDDGPGNIAGTYSDAQALKLVLAGKEADARNLVEGAYKAENSSSSRDPDVPYLLAAFESRSGEYGTAIKHLSESQDLLGNTDRFDPKRQMLLQKRLGDCYYKNDDLKLALQHYQAALIMYSPSSNLPEVTHEELLEAVVACAMRNKDYGEAEKYAQFLLASTKARNQANPVAILNLIWSYFLIADIYATTAQTEKLDAVRSELRPLVEYMVDLRMNADAEGKLPSYKNLMGAMRANYVAQLQPNSPSDILWAACDFKVRTMPVVGWKSQIAPPKAAIICVHGLGLENHAFEFTAQELNRRGYLVYAIDVRGFGAWTQSQGLEDIDYDRAIDDIGAVASAIRRKSPNTKIFVLGESMGGAIAVRAGAKLGDAIDGVISSVPSAERFQQKKMTFQTAAHFIVDPHRSFDVGYVAEMATSDRGDLNAWKSDPKAKLRLTPMELTEFAIFMRRTKAQAEKINKLPVLMVQGLKDRLVKPQGTFELFDAVGCEDKSLYLAGPAEHLMFENTSPNPILMDTVDSWLANHLAPPSATPQQGMSR